MRTLLCLSFILCTGLILLFSACSTQKEFPVFSTHIIDSVGKYMGQTDLADMDNDGDLDWVVGEAPHGNTSNLWWWEYKSANEWVRHEMGKANSDVGGDCYDVNGDGWMDFWGGSVLFLNQKDGSFSRHEVGTIFSHDSQFADVDGDENIDGIANSDTYGLVWYSIPDDPTQSWTEHMIQPAEIHRIHGGVSPNAVGDMDGDGDHDVVTGQAWYRNLDGKGLEWEEVKNIEFGEVHTYGIALKTWVIDLDEDGDNDFVQAEADNPDSRVAWFENDGSGNWTAHIIKDKGDGQDFHSLVVADFDQDGDVDICSGGGPLSTGPHKIYIWEQVKNQEWVEHVIGNLPCHEAVGGDVDRDGDIDICTKPWTTGSKHVYFENLLK